MCGCLSHRSASRSTAAVREIGQPRASSFRWLARYETHGRHTLAQPRTFGNGGAPCQLAFMDPETDTSFAFLTNGYPMTGYDYSRLGINRIVNIGDLGNDLVA